MYIYHIALDDGVVFEIPAMPITEAVQLDEEELEYSHALGSVIYIVHHMVDSDGCYYTVTVGEATERQDDIDYDSIVDIRIKLTSPDCLAYGSIDEVKRAIAKAIDDVKDIYDYAMGY